MGRDGGARVGGWGRHVASGELRGTWGNSGGERKASLLLALSNARAGTRSDPGIRLAGWRPK
jgi:hypothetical protein